MKLLLFATHPIQYQAPWFRALAVHPEIDLTVAFGMLPSAEEQAVGFDVAFEWDLPLLDGYRSIQLELAAGRRSISSFRGIRVRNLDAVLEREVADLVLVTGWNSWMLVQAANAAKRRGIPLIVRGESNDLRRRPAGVRWLQRRFLARFDACLAIGSANRRFLEARGIAPERIFDTPYFVDNARFVDAAAKLEGQREGIRNRWSIPSSLLCVLFAGKLIPKKRPLDVVRAVAVAREAGADLHLLIAGDGELREATESACRAAAIPSTFAGFLNQTQIPEAYSAADLLALPSDAGETWGLVVNEAMASGRPALVSREVGSAEDLVLANRTGWTHELGDTDAMAERLVEASHAPDRLLPMGALAKAHVVENFSVDRAVEGTVRACRSALAGRGGG